MPVNYWILSNIGLYNAEGGIYAMGLSNIIGIKPGDYIITVPPEYRKGLGVRKYKVNKHNHIVPVRSRKENEEITMHIINIDKKNKEKNKIHKHFVIDER